MSKASLRVLLTILMYFGVVVFLYPYLTDSLSRAMLLLIGGAALTIAAGLCRCLLTEGDCLERHSLDRSSQDRNSQEHHSSRPAP